MAEAHTFSITARCPETGMVGVAVASRFLAVGALCPHVAAGAGAIASQALVNPLLGIQGLRLLATGKSAQAVLDELLAADEGEAFRQVGVVDVRGNAAAHTGSNCIEWAGHRTGDGYVVAGNLLTGPDVLAAMEQAYLASKAMPFHQRLLAALEAGQARGGDKRGKQAAAIRIAHTEEYPFLDLRVDDHPDPIPELKRLAELSDKTFAPYRSFLPTRENPSGIIDPEAIAAVRAKANRQSQS